MSVLEKAPDIKVVGEAKDGVEAQQLVAEFRPDVLLLDFETFAFLLYPLFYTNFLGRVVSAILAQRESLTERERQVLQLLADGLGNAAIAKALGVTSKTVAYHVTNILSKLGVASRLEAAVWVHHCWPDSLRDDLQDDLGKFPGQRLVIFPLTNAPKFISIGTVGSVESQTIY